MTNKYNILIIFLLMIFISCKKDLYNSNLEKTTISTNILTLSKAQAALKKTLNNKRINKIASNSTSTTISEYIPDSIYNDFYWDYATTEENINGFPAILVPIKMQSELDYSLFDGMNNKGYRVAVFQHSYEKDDVLISFRDYHPDDDFIKQRMQEYSITSYPTNFLTFQYLLGDIVNGHIVFLDGGLNPLRVAKIINNEISEYIDIPYADNHKSNILINEPTPVIPVIPCQQTQIAYPDFEIEYIKTTISTYTNEPVYTTGNNKDGITAHGYNVGRTNVTSVQINTVWKTASIGGEGDCSSSTRLISVGISSGGSIDKNSAGNDICKILADLLKKLNLVRQSNTKINIHKNSEGKSIEAGYTLYKTDLKSNHWNQSELSKGHETEVMLNRSFNPNHGYHMISNHYHPNDLPHSFKDILLPVPAYNGISDSPLSNKEKDYYRQQYLQNFTSFVETQHGDYYIYSIKDIKKLNQIASQKSESEWMKYEDDRRLVLLNENNELQDYKAAENILLNTFGDAINLYKAMKQDDGSYKFYKLTNAPNISNPVKKIAHYFAMNCN